MQHARAECGLPGTEWPPTHVLQHLRSIELKFRRIGSSILKLLRHITNGTTFGQLYMMKIDCSGDYFDEFHFDKTWAVDEVLKFPARFLEVKYRHVIFNGRIDEDDNFGTPYDTFEMVLFDKLTVQGREENKKVFLERYHQDRDKNEKDTVDGWPGIAHDLRTRYTRKVVSI
jgi:hypothetical protein